ncbi:MAG: heavy metal translocating P-type ATPase [Cyanobacteria bacterium J06642_3]
MVKIPVKPEPDSSSTRPDQTPISQTIVLDVSGMKCAGCVGAVERQLKNNPGVESASVNLITEVAVVAYQTEALDPQILADKLTKTGFPSSIRNSDRTIAEATQQAQAKRNKQQQEQFKQLIIAAGLLFFSSLGHLHHLGMPAIPVLSNIWFHWGLATLALLIPGRNLLVDGARSLLNLVPNMNTLIGLGTISAYTTSCLALWIPRLGWECFFDEPVMLLGFIFLGRTLESRAKNQASAALEKLVSLQPTMARLVGKDAEDPAIQEAIEIPVEQVKAGEWLRVLAGETIPVDGQVISGSSTIEESMLTGESLPVSKTKGDRLFAGTTNQQGILTFEVTNTGGETTLAKIINLVQSAQVRKAPVQKLADQIAGYFAYGVMAIALLTFGFWYGWGTSIWPQVLVTHLHHGLDQATSPLLLSIKLAISVLVVACPCALGLATPTAILIGTSIGAEQGILIKGGDILEQIEKLKIIVFDKTGTLTEGNLELVESLALNGFADQQLLQLSASLARYSNHPLAKAIAQAAGQQQLELLPLTNIQEQTGLGMSGEMSEELSGKSEQTKIIIGNREWLETQQIEVFTSDYEQIEKLVASNKNILYVAKQQQLVGLLVLSDRLRPEAATTINQLNEQGIQTILLSGDRQEVAGLVAQELGIEKVFAQVKPEGKATIIESLQTENQAVAMIGDGINDAIALAQADIGISLAGSTDIAVETADLVLMKNNLADLITAIELSKATVQKIKQNLFWALGYNAIAIPLAAGAILPSTGVLLSPVLAALAMASSSLIVVGNSLLLKNKF